MIIHRLEQNFRTNLVNWSQGDGSLSYGQNQGDGSPGSSSNIKPRDPSPWVSHSPNPQENRPPGSTFPYQNPHPIV